MKKTLLKWGVLSAFALCSFNLHSREIIFDAEGTKRFTAIPLLDQSWFKEHFPAWAENVNTKFPDFYIPADFYFDSKLDHHITDSKDHMNFRNLAVYLEGWKDRIPKDWDPRAIPAHDLEFQLAYELSTGNYLSRLSAFEIHKLDKQYYIDLYREAFKRQLDSLHINKLVIKNHCYNNPYAGGGYMDDCTPSPFYDDKSDSSFNESAYNFDNQTYKLDMYLSNIPIEKVLFNKKSDSSKIGELLVSLPIDIAEKMSKSDDIKIYLSYTLVDGEPLFNKIRDSYGQVHPLWGIRVSGTNFEKITDISALFVWGEDKESYMSDSVRFNAEKR